MPTYNQDVKIKARRAALRQAIKTLTRERTNATLASRDYLRRMWKELTQSDTLQDRLYNAQLTAATIKRWERFYDSAIGSKKPSELKVAYLCGPEPLNDLEVLMNCGVLPENVWAFESNSKEYETAVAAALNSAYPFLKIVKTDLRLFLEATPIKFDLIYLDFCGPLYNRDDKQKNLPTLTAIAKHQSLNSPGVLLTNFSLPSATQDPEGYRILSRLTAGYLYPKSFLENPNGYWGVTEGPPVHSIYEKQWDSKVARNLPGYYGQFITRLVMDIFNYLVPADRFISNPRYVSSFFKIYNEKNKLLETLDTELVALYDFDDSDGGGGDMQIDPGFFSASWTFAAYSGRWPHTQDDAEFIKHGKRMIRQLAAFSTTEEEFARKLVSYQYLMTEGVHQRNFYSDSLKSIAKGWLATSRYQFCDLFLFHQVKDLLVRQISVPYQVNVEKTKRWTYWAKETQMFMDMTVLDECRYLYDWMPTLDMLKENLKNEEMELSIRYILDALGKHTRWYYEEIFYGTAVVDVDRPGFEAKTFAKRVKLRSPKPI